MTDHFPLSNLTNHFLIAMPRLEDEFFGRSVVYMCDHNDQGALGIIINKPSDIKLQDLFEKIDLSLDRMDVADFPVFVGGPVQQERGFVLHEGLPPSMSKVEESSRDSQAMSPEAGIYSSTLVIAGANLEMTTSRDVLEAMAQGGGPRQVLVSLGYSAWGPGQLETELMENSWLTVPADVRLIFETPVSERYDQALALLGLQSWMISSQVGHA